MNTPWTPDSWKTKPIAQRIEYPDPAALDKALAALAKLPPLVTSWEVERLKSQLAEAAARRAVPAAGRRLLARVSTIAGPTRSPTS